MGEHINLTGDAFVFSSNGNRLSQKRFMPENLSLRARF